MSKRPNKNLNSIEIHRVETMSMAKIENAI